MIGVREEPITQVQELSVPEGILRVEQHGLHVSWESGPLEAWRYTDHGGHQHHYDMTTHNYPTLAIVVDEWCFTDHGLFGGTDPDGHPAASHYECGQCGEKIEPATGPGSAVMHTGQSWTLTAPGQPPRQLAEPEAREILERMRSALLGKKAKETASRLGYPEEFA